MKKNDLAESLNLLIPGALFLLIAFSNGISSGIIETEVAAYPLWMMVSALAFGFGWAFYRYTGKQVAYKYLKIATAAGTLAGILVTILIITSVKDYSLFAEKVFASLFRNMSLSVLAFLGYYFMMYRNRITITDADTSVIGNGNESVYVRKEAELLMREARIQASAIVQKAEEEAERARIRKVQYESELKQFLHTEKVIIEKLEQEIRF